MCCRWTVFDYTLNEFGVVQADAYLNGLDAVFVELAKAPGIAHAIDEIRLGYRRYLF